jgi:hypothetical protein
MGVEVMTMSVSVSVSMTVTMAMSANLELIYILAGRGSRGTVVRRWLRRWLLSHGATVVVVVVVMMMAAMTDVAFTLLTYGLSNDRCDGSSSENECNGMLDLNHF